MDTREAVGGSDGGEGTIGGAYETGLSRRGVAALLVGLLVPGAGHLMLARWRRGAALVVLLFGTLAFGLSLQGRLYVPGDTILTWFYSFADVGLGLIYLVSWATGVGMEVHAKEPGFEFGTNLIVVAGLLNYLVALDAYDLGAGRKP